MPQEQITALAEALTAELGRPVEATNEAVSAALREWAERIEGMAAEAAAAESMDPEELDEEAKAAVANFASIKSALGLDEDADADAVRARVFALQMGVKHAGRTRLAAVVADFDNASKDAPKTHEAKPANGAKSENGARSQRYGGVSIPRESLKGVKDALGYMVDGNNRALKSLGYTIGQNGGWLVNRETSAELIELFYANEVAMALGATRVDMGNAETLTYRKMKSGATAYWGAMGQTTTQSQPAFGIVNLNLRELVAETPISQRLIKNSAVNVEQLVRNDIVKAMNLAADYAFLYGTGSKTGSNTGYEPLGLLNHPDVNEVTIATNGKIPAPQDFVNRWGAIEDANVPASDSWGLAVSPRTLRTIRNTTDTTGQLIPEERFTQGHRVASTTQISNSFTTGTATSATSDAFFGAWEYMVVGVGQDVELIVDTSIYVRQREVLVQGVMYVDMGISHPEAFQVLRGLKA